MGDDFRIRAKIYPWISVKTFVPKVCISTNHEKSEKLKWWAPVQGQARFNLNFEENFWCCSCNLDVSLWQRNSNATKKVWLFSGLNAIGLTFFCSLFSTLWLLLKFSSGNLVYHLVFDLVVHHHRTLLRYLSTLVQGRIKVVWGPWLKLTKGPFLYIQNCR